MLRPAQGLQTSRGRPVTPAPQVCIAAQRLAMPAPQCCHSRGAVMEKSLTLLCALDAAAARSLHRLCHLLSHPHNNDVQHVTGCTHTATCAMCEP